MKLGLAWFLCYDARCIGSNKIDKLDFSKIENASDDVISHVTQQVFAAFFTIIKDSKCLFVDE